MQFVERMNWIERFQCFLRSGSRWYFHVVSAIDGIHYGDCGDCCVGSDREKRRSVHGRFPDFVWSHDWRFLCATDGLLFYVFFEATLIPMYIIVGVWGGPNRVYAAFKFFLYTLLGFFVDLGSDYLSLLQVESVFRYLGLASITVELCMSKFSCSSLS